MRCWKCGKDLQGRVTNCVYCNASQKRPSPKTKAGSAMRQIYDQIGRDAVLTRKQIMLNALHDLLEDSQKLRKQLDLVYESGIADLYLAQLQGSGIPDASFKGRVKILITQDAGLSESIAADIMTYFDEMIGWSVVSSSQSRQSGQSRQVHEEKKSYSSQQSKEDINRESREEYLKWLKEQERKAAAIRLEHERKKTEEKRQQQAKQQNHTSSQPSNSDTRTIKESIPDQKPDIDSSLPTCKVDGGAYSFYMGLAVIFLIANFAVPNAVTPVLMIIALVIALLVKPKGPKSVHILSYGNGQYSVKWDMNLRNRWAVAVQGRWIASGTEKVDEVKFTANSLPVTISICTISKDGKQSTLQGKVQLTAKGVME